MPAKLRPPVIIPRHSGRRETSSRSRTNAVVRENPVAPKDSDFGMIACRRDAYLLFLCLALGRAVMMPTATLILENAALRQQLAVYQRTETRPRLRPGDRIFWVVLRRVWAEWPRHLVLVKPATVIG
jgi:hypothetical protein